MQLIQAHGDKLINLVIETEQAKQLNQDATNYQSWDLSERQICDLELLANGGFSPLDRFMGQQDYDSCVNQMRLDSGELWPIPITLDVSKEFANDISLGEKIALRDAEGVLLAVLEINDIWTPDKQKEALNVYGTDDLKHPAVAYLFKQSGAVYLGGSIQATQLPRHYDYRNLRHTPAELRERFKQMGWSKIVAFQTRNPMHRAHQEITLRAAKQLEANLLIHPVVGMTKIGDVDHFTRVRCYEHLLKSYPEQTTALSLLPLAMRMGGPREALWHAIIRKNYGCTHLIVGRDHAGPGKDSHGKDFYGPYDAQQMLQEHQSELGITMVPFQMMVYVQERAQYIPADEVNDNETALNLSGTELRRRLVEGLDIPDWFSYPDVVKELRRTYPPRNQQGFTVFFTGLSGAGKSTIANALVVRLMESGNRPVTVLDGDLVRKHLSSELGFSKEHRNINVLRIGYVASEITKNSGIAICAPIAPYKDTRDQVREMISVFGAFLEVHVSTPLDVCESRDRKGLYAKARAGIIGSFTGISDPYETPINPELSIDTSKCDQEEAVQRVLLKLEHMGLLSS